MARRKDPVHLYYNFLFFCGVLCVVIGGFNLELVYDRKLINKSESPLFVYF